MDSQTQSTNKAQQIVKALEWNIRLGLLYCRIAQKYRQAFADKQLFPNNWFDFGIFRACRDGAVLALTRITDPSKGKYIPASLMQLLEHSEQHPEDYGHPSIIEEIKKQFANTRTTSPVTTSLRKPK